MHATAGVIIPPEYKYVLSSLLTIPWLLLGQHIMVGRFRNKAGIAYPQMYAEKAEVEASRDAHLFNCAQRAHQNTLEILPVILITVLVSGINFPRFSAITLLVFFASRIVYSVGYVTGDPSKRSGILYRMATLCVMGLLVVNSYIAARWVLEGI